MIKVVGIRFKAAGKIYYFDPADINIDHEDYVIVETIRGIEFGEVVLGPKEVEEKDIVAPLKEVIRVASQEDIEIDRENKQKALEAMEICQEKVNEHELEMKIVDVEYTFDNNKVIFYFTADGRVDFRDLVKDLAAIFRTRIELRQIGVRDEAKMIGGIGPCGRKICCHQFLGEFDPVSIKMAKEQSLSLNPTKISGLCGRLMCCLKYEQENYEELLKKMPEIGELAKTEDGQGRIVDSYTLLETVKIRVKLEDDSEEIRQYKLSEIELIGDKNSSFDKKNKKRKRQESKSSK